MVWTDHYFSDKQFNECPIKFIPDSVFEFLKIEAFDSMHKIQNENYYKTSARYTKYKFMFEGFKNWYQKVRQAELGNN